VQLKSGERLIKQVRRTMSGWLLESINQAYESREVRDLCSDGVKQIGELGDPVLNLALKHLSNPN
jgi:hypothetical protein